jgi:hypothetical protein
MVASTVAQPEGLSGYLRVSTQDSHTFFHIMSLQTSIAANSERVLHHLRLHNLIFVRWGLSVG